MIALLVRVLDALADLDEQLEPLAAVVSCARVAVAA